MVRNDGPGVCKPDVGSSVVEGLGATVVVDTVSVDGVVVEGTSVIIGVLNTGGSDVAGIGVGSCVFGGNSTTGACVSASELNNDGPGVTRAAVLIFWVVEGIGVIASVVGVPRIGGLVDGVCDGTGEFTFVEPERLGSDVGGSVESSTGATVAGGTVSKRGAAVKNSSVGINVDIIGASDIPRTGVGGWVATKTGDSVGGESVSTSGIAVEAS